MEVEGVETYLLEEGDFAISIKKGEKKDIPAHLALVMERHGIVKIDGMTNVDVKKRTMNEKASPHLTDLPEDFYESAAYVMEHCDGKERIRLSNSLRELVRARLEKIHRLCLQEKHAPGEMQNIEKGYYAKTQELVRETLDFLDITEE